MKKNDKIRAEDLDQEHLTFEDLCYLYGTGQAYIISNDGRKNYYGYRFGVMTRLGDMEISQWEMLLRRLIERSGEQVLQENLLNWVTKHSPYLRTERERRIEALALHSARIFEDPKWVDFEAFRREYGHLLTKETEESRGKSHAPEIEKGGENGE